jgi:predicted nucleic acid-binding protein
MNLLDSDVLIEIQRASQNARKWLASVEREPVALPSPVAIEFLIGSRNRAELSAAQLMLTQFEVEWMNESDSRLAMQLVSDYRLTSGLGFADFHIAAQALNRDATLYTFNLKHFNAIANLKARTPFSR